MRRNRKAGMDFSKRSGLLTAFLLTLGVLAVFNQAYILLATVVLALILQAWTTRKQWRLNDAYMVMKMERLCLENGWDFSNPEHRAAALEEVTLTELLNYSEMQEAKLGKRS